MSKNRQNLRVGLLCVKNDPLISVFLRRLYHLQFIDFHIIFDEKHFSDYDLDIIHSRLDPLIVNDIIDHARHVEFLRHASILDACDHNSVVLKKYVKANNIEVLLNIGTTKKISKTLINSCKYGIINVHPGTLPFFRGSCAVEWAILNDKPIDLTAHKMSVEYDAGDIAIIERVVLCPHDNYQKIRTKIYAQSSNLFEKILTLAYDGALHFRGQLEEFANYYQPIDASQLNEVKRKLPRYLKRYYASPRDR